MTGRIVLFVLVAAVASACSADAADVRSAEATARPAPTVMPTTTSSSTTRPSPATSAPAEPQLSAQTTPRPAWLGTRVLPVGQDGFGEVQPTPPELVDRRFATIDLLPPPAAETFEVTVETVSEEVAARSTWAADCPVTLDDLRRVLMPFWGFDGRLHTGELLVHVDAVEVVTAGFAALFARRFPIEEMRIVAVDELDAPPTGDGNNTTAFVCRPSRGATRWSEHAYGRAVDINPFHNPYVKGDVVLPELASAYADRSVIRPGMLTDEDVAGFDAGGWGWGGRWRSLSDHMHLSASGR